MLPQNKSAEHNTLFTVICVAALSNLAMIIYLIVAKRLEWDAHQVNVVSQSLLLRRRNTGKVPRRALPSALFTMFLVVFVGINSSDLAAA
ncbi:hypothetical protein G7009_13895 [Pseudomonas capeferrum]|uniref:hypothetical protein n=1 Tax=Pseudomonas capeferrum TaxID=1495066 RepID=UPI0015E395B8|nr:hypothetical protein [Pseudomonas capeferrum]MBA1202833.1 hypothetical protein [Pseudomonas capeferrum]